MKKQIHWWITSVFILLILNVYAQDIQRERPKEWEQLIRGGAFIDLFDSIPVIGELSSETWGWEAVKPRYVDNGIEEAEWSYWGGNIIVDAEGLFHLFLCRWPENNEKGHMYWANSEVVHTVSKNTFGPYKVTGEVIGKGHNPEIFQLTDGRYVIYVIDGYYISNDLNGPWEKGKFEFNSRDRKIIEGLSNLSFVEREDGTYLMVCRGGGIWVSKTGISPYNQVSNKSVYPAFDGRYEDPVIWRTGFQYHLIVNDWYGRIAYYLRSKDGFNWKVEPGEAYTPGITKYTDGTVEDWYKYERLKILQDEYGRAIQANFAVIDTSKWGDLGNDNHSSKNISIPLIVEKRISILNSKKITSKTKLINLKIKAEEGFNPLTDIDFESLRFGASEEVNFGKGCKVVQTKSDGNDLIVTFDGQGNGLTDNNFAGKLLGKTKRGKILFGYSKLPGVNYNESFLSATKPVVKVQNNKKVAVFEVQNFGQVQSKSAKLILEISNEKGTLVANGKVNILKPFEKESIHIQLDGNIGEIENYNIKITTKENKQKMPLFEQKIEISE